MAIFVVAVGLHNKVFKTAYWSCDLNHFCLAGKAEARHRYCFSSAGGVDGVNLSRFLLELCFSGSRRATVMKLGTYIHLREAECTLKN